MPTLKGVPMRWRIPDWRTPGRKLLALITLAALLASPAAGFDTYWHSQASQAVGQAFGFSEHAWKVMQMGNFAPDFFGPVADFASKGLKSSDIDKIGAYNAQNGPARAAAIFMHFDNLNAELTRNSQFDYIFTQLLHTTQNTLAAVNKRNDIDARTKKVLILVALGASLHTVQDFYSHSDWIHNDFNKLPVKMMDAGDGRLRAPTWYEFRAKAGDPDKWPIQVHTGIYPPSKDSPNTHTHMNHDNSELVYRELEVQGSPLIPQAPWHQAGDVPAHQNDANSVQAHQRLAVDTSIAASIEWVKMVEQNADAKAAIDSAKDWNIKTSDPKLYKELQAGMMTQMALSCAAGRWDGEEPPPDRGALCQSVLQRKLGNIDVTSGSQIESEIIGLATSLALPYALKFTGKFWDIYPQYHVLEQLTEGIGSSSGHYSLAKK